MVDCLMHTINFPTRGGVNRTEQIVFEDGANLVVLGSNGSGKSRLGAWIEKYSTNQYEVHRISAQRKLAVPTTITLYSIDQATNMLLYATNKKTSNSSKWNSRWSNKPTTVLLDDFSHVLSLLFAAKSKRDRELVDALKKGDDTSPVVIPPTGIELIISIWNSVFSHRQLEFDFDTNQINARIDANGTTYAASEMSDGERSAIYLMGQCLAVPPHSILIIDEPELHLHKSILANLWDQLEQARHDCLFIYLTHDLDFAATRTSAKKIIIETFDGNNWSWQEAPDIANIPDPITLKILGSRKPVIFIEGSEGKFDTTFYRSIYPSHLVIPLGSSRQVIEATRALKSLQNNHRWAVHGLIDRDYRAVDQLDLLQQAGIHALGVAEIENIFCVEEIVKTVASEAFGLEPDVAFERCKRILFESLEKEAEQQVVRRTEAIVEEQLRVAFGGRHVSVSDLKRKLTNLAKDIDVDAIYLESKRVFDTVLTQRNYREALVVFNQKGLVQKIAHGIDQNLSQSTYIKLILNLVAKKQISLSKNLKAYLPDF